MGKPRLTRAQLHLLQRLSDFLGTGEEPAHRLWGAVGMSLDRCHANGGHYFLKKLHRLKAAGFLAQSGSGGRRRWRLGPLADLFREQGKLI
jgi:hypothetical protein